MLLQPRCPLPLRCPCCFYRTLTARGDYEICPVCFWEDDGQDDHNADEVRGGPNAALSLTAARANYAAHGACEPRFGPNVRPPLPHEMSPSACGTQLSRAGKRMGPFLDGWTIADVETVIARDDPDEVLFAPIVVSLDPPDCEWAESVCARLAAHREERVRANALLGFGHLVRTCGRLNMTVVQPLIAAGKGDPSPLVRGHAESAADDIETSLGWSVIG